MTSLSVCRKTTYFLYIGFYSTMQIKAFVSNEPLLMETLQSFKHRAMLPCNGYNFTSFLVCIPFINLFCRIVSDKASNTVLKESKNCGHLCVTLDVGIMVSSPPPR